MNSVWSGARGYVSALNSSTAALASGATFLGGWEDTLGVESVVVAAKTDQDGTIVVEFSPDGTNVDSTLTRHYRTAKINPTHRTKVLCDVCLSIIETGSPERLYGVWVYLKDGAGLTAGAHQGTDRSDSVDRMVRLGVAKWEAAHGSVPQDDDHPVWRAKFWALPILKADATVPLDPDNLPAWAVELGKWWEACSVLQEFRDAQDEVFERDYWLPAVEVAREVGLTSPLGMLVAYDSMVQSGANGPLSMRKLRRQFSERSPKNGGNEAAWLSAYVRTRHAILSHHPRKAVRTSAYRTEALLDLCNAGNLGLATPFVMRAGNKRVRVEEP